MKIKLSALFIFLIAVAGCSKKDDSTTTDQNPYAVCRVISNGDPVGQTNVTLALVDMNKQAAPITGATVKVNNITITDNGDGSYSATINQNPINAGAQVTLTISCEAGDFNATGTMPDLSTTTVSIDGCFQGSYMELSNINVQ
ncbi:MAG TPA: hypothetical protein VJ963_00265 [Bacteroidales bacterium]|nr:hypothetical protein [Bacteroidales bacterium]